MAKLTSTDIYGSLYIQGNALTESTLSATQLISTITNVAPLVVASTHLVANLNADLLDGKDSTAFYLATNPSGFTTNVGTVTSVSLALPSEFTITNSSVTTSGTLTGNWTSQTAKTFFAAPSGSNGAPTFRTILASDIPLLNQSTTGQAGKVAKSLVITSDGGSTEGTNKYTFDGSTAKAIDFKAGSNVTITKTVGGLEFKAQDTTYTSLKNPNALTVGNGLKISSGISYDGSAALTISHGDTATGVNNVTGLTGKSIISGIDIDTYGHISEITTRDLTLANLGYTGATDADKYTSWKLEAYNSTTALASGNITSGSTAKFRAGSNITLAQTANEITINASNKVYKAGTGLILSGTDTFDHTNTITAATASGSTGTVAFGGTITIPSITYDSQGHITSKGTTTVTLPVEPDSNTDSYIDTASFSTANGTLSLGRIGTSAKTITVNLDDRYLLATNFVNNYITDYTWSNGTTAGPTSTIKRAGLTDISVGAIPSASATVSGVVTTGTQTFKGNKTIDGTLDTTGNIRIGSSNILSNDGVNLDGTSAIGLRATNSNGYISFSPLNGDWAHIYTDRSKFIINKGLYIFGGAVSSYSTADLLLQKNGVTKLTLASELATFETSALFKSDVSTTGNVVIGGNLTVQGENTILNTATVSTQDDIIQLRSGATTIMTGYSGLVATKYDGTNDGALVFDNSGTAYVGDVTIKTDGTITDVSMQPLLTRDKTTNLTDNDILIWNGSKAIGKTINELSLQPYDQDLTAIGELTGTSGFLKKTAANTWSLDTNTYITGNQSITLSGDISGSGTTAITTTIGTGKVTNSMLAGSIGNTKLANSTISGIALGSNLKTLTIGAGLSGLSYDGSTAITITNSAPNVTTNISIDHKATSVDVKSSDGTNGTINGATSLLAGIMTNADKVKLDGIAENANKYILPTASESVLGGIKVGTNLTMTAGVLSADSQTQNNFTTTLKNKLDGIAENATNTAAPYYTSAIAVGDGGLTQKNFTTTLKNKLDGIAANANKYTHPAHPGDDFDVDTGTLAGAWVVSKVDINVTTDLEGHVTDANGAVATRQLTLADLGYVAPTIPTVNDGTLTLSTNGAGISGSTTFTANQAAAGTFTVTSNATTVATPDTISLRDVGGNITTKDELKADNFTMKYDATSKSVKFVFA